MKEQNKRLIEEKLGLSKDIEHMKERLSSAEAVVFSLGTPEAIRQRITAAEPVPRPEIPSIPVTDHRGSGTKDVPEPSMSTPPMVDLSDSPPEPAKKRPVWGAESSQGATKSTSILSILKSGQKPTERRTILEGETASGADLDMSKGDGVGAGVPTPTPKLISLTGGGRTEDATGKRLRPAEPSSQDQEQPASKKPIAQQDDVSREDRLRLVDRQERQELEKEIQNEVKRSCSV
jgi:hypothetical protein